MSKWEPRAVIVLILALAVSIGHMIAVVLLAWRGMPLGEAGSDVLIAVLGAIVAIIAGYVANKNADISKTKTLPQEKQQPEKDDDNLEA